MRIRALLAATGAVVMVAAALAIVIFKHSAQSNPVEPATPPRFFEEGQRANKIPNSDNQNSPDPKPSENIGRTAVEQPDLPAPTADGAPKPLPPLLQEQEIVVVDVRNWNGDADPAVLEHDLAPKEFFLALTNRLTKSSPVVSPAVPSHYLAVNFAGMEAEYEIWNHYQAHAKSLLRIKCGIADGIAVHRDGEYVAVLRSPSNDIEVFSVIDQRTLYTLANPCGGARSALIEFVGNSLIVFDPRDGVLRFFETLTRQNQRNVRIHTNSPSSFALSPRHRYLAFADLRHATVCLIDLTQNIPQAIKLPIPKNILSGALLTCHLRFSPKGDQVAALVKSHLHARMMCWNVKDGSLEHQHPLPTKPGLRHPGEDNSFEWLPDSEGWLLAGGDYVHKEHGGPAASLKHFLAENQTPVCVTPDGRLLVVSKLGNQRTLESFPWPKERVAQAVLRFANGELPNDIKFPPLTAIDDSVALHPSAPAGPVVWQVKPNPVADSSSDISKSVTLASSRQNLTKLAISEQAARALLFFEPGQDAEEPGRRLRRIEAYDLKTEKLHADFDVSFPSRMITASSDGSQVLLRSDEGDRLDILNATTGNHSVGFRPYANERHQQGSAITAALFVGNDRVLTMNTGGVIVLWKVPTCEAVYEFRTNFSGTPQAAPVLSPDGRYVAVAANHSILLLEAKTGKCHGRLDTRGMAPISVLAFHPQGSRLAAGFHAGDLSRLKVWKLDDGKEAAEVALPASPTDLVWCGPNHLICNGRFLADLTKQALVWRYVAPAGRIFPNNNFGLCWYVTSTVLHDPATLVAISLPDQEVNQRLGQMPMPAPLFPADAPFRLTVDTERCPEPIRETLSSRIHGMLSDSRHEVRPDAPYQLKINASEAPTGRYMQISGLLFGLATTGSHPVPIDRVTVHFELSDRQGATIWKNDQKFETSPLEITFPLPDGGDHLKPLKENLWNRVAGSINPSWMPSVVHPSDVREGYGESHLTSEGPQLHQHNPLPSATQTKRPGTAEAKSL